MYKDEVVLGAYGKKHVQGEAHGATGGCEVD